MKSLKKYFSFSIGILNSTSLIAFVVFALFGCTCNSPSAIRESNAKRHQNKAVPNQNTTETRNEQAVIRITVPEKISDEILSSEDIQGQSNSENTITISSWNIEDLGKSKSDATINFIAHTIKGFDIIAIQEVVAGYGGAQAVAQIVDNLNRNGAKWDYKISDPTSGESSYKRERYAFIWKTSRVSIVGRPWLEIKITNEINREPFFATFKFNDKLFTLVNFHAITKKMQPETEIKYFKFLPDEYPDKNLIFCGDFNCPQSHTVFNPLKRMGYQPIFTGQKTTLKMQPVNDEFLASEFDNIFYNVEKIEFINSGVVHFYNSFTTLTDARTVSDHIPIWFQFSIK